ncbi:MerR family transcriptional regulator ['Paenibacillus yunnanensis' Narsing Rao et al. 2020]|uniref:MerR family transcriptional regulator n=1 Tax=Paenibacillus tengchongensis TaxID=2608684 RepID=UPI00124C00B1|nr:MerR family transcriptional regulator [Paenibacillus tengchongensis]
MYTVGQLAKQTGVSVRTLHYYEKLGLLHPARGESGYRLYADSSIIRLQQITVLKKMRFTLSEIAEMLSQSGGEAGSPAEVWERSLEQQVAIVRQQQKNLQTVEHLLRSAQYAIRATGQLNTAELMGFIRELEQFPAPDTGRRERYFTADERAELPINDFDNPLVMEWADILRDMKQQLQEPPDSAASQELAARIVHYSSRLFHGNEELADKFWSYVTPQDGQDTVIYGMTTEVMNYIEEILEIYYRSDN